MWQLDVGEAVDKRLAEVCQLVQQRVVLLLHGLVLLFHGLEAGLHGGNLAGGWKQVGFLCGRDLQENTPDGSTCTVLLGAPSLFSCPLDQTPPILVLFLDLDPRPGLGPASKSSSRPGTYSGP